MIKQASWVHGNAVILEEPARVNVKHMGWGTELHAPPQFFGAPTSFSTWCHIAIPTPVIVDDVRLKVQNIFLLFKAGQHAAIDNIHIYDGPKKIAAWNVIAGSNYSARRTGDHSFTIDNQNTFQLPEPHEVVFGLSISFTFLPYDITGPLPDAEAMLLITSAGADFF